MLIVTSLNYDQLGAFIRDKRVSLNNLSLVFGEDYEAVKDYITERLGTEEYVMGIRGRINLTSVNLLSQLDEGLKDIEANRAILEVDVSEDEVIIFDAKSIEEAIEIIAYGLPDYLIYNQMDTAIEQSKCTDGVQVICVPYIKRTRGVKVISLTRDIAIDAEDITFVSLSSLQAK